MAVRLPDDKDERLKALSRRRGSSVNRLLDEMATVTLAEFDAEARFALRPSADAGKSARGAGLLRKARGKSRDSQARQTKLAEEAGLHQDRSCRRGQ